MRNLQGVKPSVLHDENSLPDNPVDISSFYKILLETDIAQGMVFKRKRADIIHTFTMDVDQGSKCIEKIRRGIRWYTMESKDCFSNISSELKN